MNEYLRKNEAAWNRRARTGDRHARTAREEDLRNPMAALDPEGWLPGLQGRRVLCLAAGGGLQSALCAAAGARVTVVDLSEEMLKQDRRIAAARGFRIETIRASMDDLRGLPDASFAAILQPVSTCYVPDIGRVYREAARVIEENGVYVSQHKQPVNLQAGAVPGGGGYTIAHPYRSGVSLPAVDPDALHREGEMEEFLHPWKDLLGALCRAGFWVEDVSEPSPGRLDAKPGHFAHRSLFIPPYVKIKARRRPGVKASDAGRGRIVAP